MKKCRECWLLLKCECGEELSGVAVSVRTVECRWANDDGNHTQQKKTKVVVCVSFTKRVHANAHPPLSMSGDKG